LLDLRDCADTSEYKQRHLESCLLRNPMTQDCNPYPDSCGPLRVTMSETINGIEFTELGEKEFSG